jgi:hypothetical protein
VSLNLYMDVHVRRAITNGLRRRNVNVLTAQEDGGDELDDPPLLDRATSLKRVLFSQDQDLLIEAARRQRTGELFAGVIYVHQEKLTIGQIVKDLELISKAYEPDDVKNRVEYLPL